ncbi:MAG TPA: hypothetical protein VGO11_24880 [Chthoniobacteraceae bacterium]|jgi:hypothetical protein|nr:hypothetical protein [Chthoniobacteraceae bacterium]
MVRPLALLLLCALAPAGARAEEPTGIEDPMHGYYTATPTDRFTRFNTELVAGRKTLPTGDELTILRGVLKELEIPVSSQMLVYSVTSLQKNLISPRRPRALYFNDDTYVAYVPGGRIEVISLDPALGSIFYISDRVRPGQTPVLRRSEECMNCHELHYMGNIPALVLESVVPGMTGGGEKAFRREQSGHGIPLGLRFGGWHLTGTGGAFPANWSNKIIERTNGEAREVANPLGKLFDPGNYLLPTSDVLPQLLQEHQVGFANRATHATYQTRVLLRQPDSVARRTQLEALAKPLVRYLLFADEVPLPPGSVLGNPEYQQAFAANRRPDANGRALKDLDLQTRLLRYRCSYMIYTPVFAGLPTELKNTVYRQLSAALAEPAPAEYAYLKLDEKRAIVSILRSTLTDLPKGR